MPLVLGSAGDDSEVKVGIRARFTGQCQSRHGEERMDLIT